MSEYDGVSTVVTPSFEERGYLLLVRPSPINCRISRSRAGQQVVGIVQAAVFELPHIVLLQMRPILRVRKERPCPPRV